MDNPLQKYHNRDLRGAIQGMTVRQGTAKDSGNPYYYISITFVNGYEKRLFLNSDETFAWCNAFEQLSTVNQMDADF